MKRLLILTTLAAALMSTAAYSITDYQQCLLDATATDIKERIAQYNKCNAGRDLTSFKNSYHMAALCTRMLTEIESIPLDRAKKYCGITALDKAIGNN